MGAVPVPLRLVPVRRELGPFVALVVTVVSALATAAGLLLFVRTDHTTLSAPEVSVPAPVVLLVATVLAGAAMAMWADRWQRRRALLGLAGSTCTGLLSVWSSWTDLPDVARAALLPLSALVVPLLVVSVTAGRSRLLNLSTATAAFAVLVHVLTYNPFNDRTCLRICESAVPPLGPVLGVGGTSAGLVTFLVAAALASILALGALMRARPPLVAGLIVGAAAITAVTLDVRHLMSWLTASGVPPHMHGRTWPAAAVALVGLVLAVHAARTLGRRRRIDRLLRQLEDTERRWVDDNRDPSVVFAVPDQDGRWVDVHGEDVATEHVSTMRPAGPTVAFAHGVLAGDLTPARRLALNNARLAALGRARLRDVRTAQSRAVRRSDEEQRRIERDLHDGAQQSLVGAAFLVAGAEHAALAEPSEELARARHRIGTALDRLRDLAHGSLPTALHEEGLPAALEELAMMAPVPVEVDVRCAESLSEDFGRALYLALEGALVQVRAPVTAVVRLRRQQRGVTLDLQLQCGVPLTLPVEVTDRLDALGGVYRWRQDEHRAVLEVSLPCES